MNLRKAAKTVFVIGSGITLSSGLVLLFDTSVEDGKKTKEKFVNLCDTVSIVSTEVGRIVKELPGASPASTPVVQEGVTLEDILKNLSSLWMQLLRFGLYESDNRTCFNYLEQSSNIINELKQLQKDCEITD